MTRPPFLAKSDADGLQAIVDGLKTSFKVQGYTFGTVDVFMPRFSARTPGGAQAAAPEAGHARGVGPGQAEI